MCRAVDVKPDIHAGYPYGKADTTAVQMLRRPIRPDRTIFRCPYRGIPVRGDQLGVSIRGWVSNPV